MRSLASCTSVYAGKQSQSQSHAQQVRSGVKFKCLPQNVKQCHVRTDPGFPMFPDVKLDAEPSDGSHAECEESDELDTLITCPK